MKVKKVLSVLKNRYVIVGIFMACWIAFFDRYNLFKRWDDTMELHRLKQERGYYIRQIADIKKKTDELQSNPESMERFARERYYMKKDNEEVYIVEQDKPEAKEDAK